ncbi:hypothetical protein [Nonlabens ulvanivorans]|uniref:hypothetical protein n=1 Tax=Nonlabens ulvanivorans TaxID=906888 RepID=UPI0032647FC4
MNNNEPDKIPWKNRIVLGLFSGLVYAGIMAAFDYASDLPFHEVKFVFSTIIFGTFMAIATRWMVKKKKK